MAGRFGLSVRGHRGRSGRGDLLEGALDLGQCLVLDLPDPFLGHADQGADLGQRHRPATAAGFESESMLQNHLLDLGQIDGVVQRTISSMAERISSGSRRSRAN